MSQPGDLLDKHGFQNYACPMSDMKWLGSNHDEVRRAKAAYFREPHGYPAQNIDQPSSDSYVVERDGLRYVVLLGGTQDGPLRVYRIRTHDGVLRRMKRWPAEIIDN